MTNLRYILVWSFAAALLLGMLTACGSNATTPAVQMANTPASAATTQTQSQPTDVPRPTKTPQPTNAPQPTSVPPSPTPEPLGLSRGNPYPNAEVVIAPNLEVKVLETVRGDKAWQAIKAANQFNETAPDGMEYLLINLRVKSTHTDKEEHHISGGDFKLTGDRLLEYSSASVVAPKPQLEANLLSGGQTEGWAAFLVGKDEHNLVLIVDELFSFDENRQRFVALDENASIKVSSELNDVKPTNLGTDHDNPAPRTERVVSEDWVVSVLDVVRGDEAWDMVEKANQFNDAPKQGTEYVAVKVHVQYIGTEDKTVQIGQGSFRSTGSANVVYDPPSVVSPEPRLEATLYPGGEFEGWIVVQAGQNEGNLTLVFDPLFDFSGGNKRYISIEQ